MEGEGEEGEEDDEDDDEDEGGEKVEEDEEEEDVGRVRWSIKVGSFTFGDPKKIREWMADASLNSVDSPSLKSIPNFLLSAADVCGDVGLSARAKPLFPFLMKRVSLS